MPIDPDTYWSPKQIEATAKYARLRTFKTEAEARDFVFRSLERTDATFGAISGVNGPLVNRAVADRVPLYASGKSYKIGKRIRNKALDWSAIDVQAQSLAPLREAGFLNPFDGYRVLGPRTFKVGDVYETERHAYTTGGRSKATAYAARIKMDRTFVMPVVNQHGVVLDGHHRLVAVRDVLKWRTIPCVVVHVNDGSDDETAAPQFSKPVIAYHGTSSKWLRGILKHGMNPRVVREGRWAHGDRDTSAHQRSRQSYGGVYWTTNLMTARSAATNYLIDSTPGGWAAVTDNILIVCARIQPQGAIPDEDQYAVRTGDLGHEALWPFMLLGARMRVATESNATLNRVVMDWVQRTAGAAPRNDLRQLKALAREVFLTEIERVFSYQSFPEYSRRMRSALDRVMRGGYELPLPRPLRLPSSTVAEARARRALDLYIHKVRGNVKARTDAGDAWNSFRTLEPVAYRGSNRIVCVVELAKRGGEAVVRYGVLPNDFREQFRQRVGDLHVVTAFTPAQEAADVA